MTYIEQLGKLIKIQFANLVHATDLCYNFILLLPFLSRIHLLFIYSNWSVDHRLCRVSLINEVTSL